jgi:hypothetical protein
MVCRSPELVARMRVAAEALLDVLDPDQRQAACAPFDTPDHREWTYLPGPRPGLAVEGLTPTQQERLFALLDTGLSVEGAATAKDVMALDDVLRDLEQARGRSGWRRRGSGQYWVRILGVPGAAAPWAWRLNGHHLAVHVTVVAHHVVGTPQFFGANPAVVRSGPQAGWQVLRPEETLARALLGALDERQRAAAVVSAEPPGDILTRRDPVADPGRVPRGVAHADMGDAQRSALERLVRQYVDRLVPDVADAAWSEIVDTGLDEVAFAWSGGTRPGEGHYYALTGPTFLVEYDNVQDGANHVHTVWRDLRHDWGADLLADHYRAVRH